MPAKVQSDNKSGETVINKQPVTADQTIDGASPFEVNANQLNRELAESTRNEMDRLPGSKEQQNINWLGSSYSGADIKMVAHLYEPSDNEEEVAKIEHDLHVAEKIRDGCENLRSGGITALAQELDPSWGYQERKSAFLSAIGLFQESSAVDNEASRFLVTSIFNGANWSSFLGLAKITKQTERIQNGHASLADALSDKLKNIREIANKGLQTVTLATLQTLSIQSHREKNAVRALGHSYVKGYTRGPRTIAGSMIFTIFNEHALAQLTRSLGMRNQYGEIDNFMKTLLPDQLPPIDITVAFANEYGSISELRLYGVEFINDGATYSIEDLMSEGVMNFVARDVDPMTSHGNIRLHRNQAGLTNEFATQSLSGSQLLFDDEGNYYKEYLARLGLRRRFMNR